MWISGGEYVYPAEIEHALTGHDAVVEASCFGIPDAQWGEVGWAAVTLAPDTAISGEELRDYLRGRLARYKVPKRIDVLPDLPRNPSGKVVKAEFRRLMEATW